MPIARYLMFRRYGPQPFEVVCRHTCDNPKCINPDHIIPGSRADNMRDKIERGRANVPFGERHFKAKLTVGQVIEIRALALPHRIIAAMFGIDKGRVSRIKSGKIWKSVPLMQNK